MLKRGSTIVAGLLLNAIVLSTLILSNPSSARACPDEPPQTLLQLYKGSKTIYLARYVKTEKGARVKKEDYEVIPVKKYFDVSTTLRGEPRKMFVLEDEEYVYDTPPADAQPDAEAAEPGHDGSDEFDEMGGMVKLKEDDNVLLFLKPGEEDPRKIELSNYADGIRKIADDEAKVYERRIRELNAIFGSKKVSDAKIVNWLVALAEDEVTRWDGAFELLQSFQNAEYAKARREDAAKDPTSGTEPSDGEETADDLENAVYSELLTDSHKSRLSQILLGRDGGAAKLVKGDVELIELVQRWGDTGVARLLIGKIRAGGHTPGETFRMMDAAAKIMADHELSELTQRFDEVAWGEDNAEVDADAEEPTETVNGRGEGEKTVDPQVNASPNAPAEAKPAVKKPTYREARALATAKYLARADVLLSKQAELAARIKTRR